MSIPTYIEGYPQDGSSLGSTKAQIRNNLDGTFQTLSVDHINNNGQPNSGTPGYHNVIHFQDQGPVYTPPPTVSGVTQMYTNTDNNNIQQLFLRSTGGKQYQETTMIDAFYPSLGTNPGWSYLPGGLVIQWGRATGQSSSGQNVTVPITYAHDIFKVFVVPFYTGSEPSASATVGVKILSSSQFRYIFQTNSSSFGGVDWITIGTMLP
jgi:hypothetical protein